jgi:hypothetical protein
MIIPQTLSWDLSDKSLAFTGISFDAGSHRFAPEDPAEKKSISLCNPVLRSSLCSLPVPLKAGC